MKTNASAPATLYIGLDVHKAETVIAILESDRDAEPRHYGSVATSQHAIVRAMRRIAKNQQCELSDFHVCYEASGCGFWIARRLIQMGISRKGTDWLAVLKTLVCYRLIDPGSEWRLHRDWFHRSAMADLLGGDFSLAQKDTLYRCHDRLLEHKTALFSHLRKRWKDLFAAKFEVLLYDLTSTYFECDTARRE